MTALKEATHDQHTRAERHDIQSALVRGELPVESYCQYLIQLRYVHGVLESSLAATAKSNDKVAKVVRESQFRLPAIDEDLAYFNATETDAPMTDATAVLCAKIEDAAANTSTGLLGFHYVLEGSTNGGRFIARAILGVYQCEPGGPGTKYLDPYGENHQAEWGRFREDMESLDLTGEETEQVIDAAGDLFDGITAIMDSLAAAESAPA